MATLSAPLASREHFLSPHSVKVARRPPTAARAPALTTVPCERRAAQVVCSASGHALYFSRASGPTPRPRAPAPPRHAAPRRLTPRGSARPIPHGAAIPALASRPAGAAAAAPPAAALDAPRRHVGVYGFRRALLAAWPSLPPSALEAAEHLEQLRALAAGVRIRVLPVAGAEPDVNVPGDVQRAREALLERARDLAGAGGAGG
jgi:CMP-2-keto-3-deoxyoctulosonic acid synthetase